MRLTEAHVTNYRSIEDSLPFKVDRVTCLVGKNESGKTTLLQALYKLNPYRLEHRTFDRDAEYPRRFVNEYDERHPDGDAEVVKTTWELEAGDLQALRSILGDVVKPGCVTVSKRYDNKQVWTLPPGISDQAAVAHALETSTLHDEERKALAGAPSIAKLKEALAATDNRTDRHDELNAGLNTNFRRGTAALAAIDVLSDRMPKFVYFSQYQGMVGRVPLEALQQKIAAQQPALDDKEKTFLDFCAFAGSSLDELAEIQNFEKLTAKFEAASNRLTREIFDFWTQNQHLRVQFSRTQAEPKDPPPFNTGRVFNVRIRNELHEVSVPFDDRSAGFVWFFSFLIVFSQVKRTLGENIILLLDEPGMTLHATAQNDLLRFIDERLKPRHQVIYTTHSPFMVPSANILSVRTVEDVVEYPKPPARPVIHGTKVRADVLDVDRATLFPIQGALGYEIAQSLFIGKHTLLVEGPSDLLYLRSFAQALGEGKRTVLDPRWTICPVGGIDKVPAFLALFGGNKLNIAVLVDIAKGQKKKVEEVERLTAEVLRTGHVFGAANYAGQAEADIEDLLGAEGYVDLVNSTYDLTGADALPLPVAPVPRIVKYVEEQMMLRPTLPNFNHYAPAEHLLTHRVALLPKLAGVDVALDNFEKLFVDLSALLPSA